MIPAREVVEVQIGQTLTPGQSRPHVGREEEVSACATFDSS